MSFPFPDKSVPVSDKATEAMTQAWYDYLKFMPVLPAAAQADQEAGTSNTVAVTPGRQQSHPSAAKAWVTFTGSTGAILASYNVASVTRNSAGNFVVTFTVPFSSASYAAVVSGSGSGFIGLVHPGGTGGITANQMPVQFVTTTFAATDPTTGHVVFFGDQ